MNNKILQYNYQIKKEKQKKVFMVILFLIFLFIFINLILNFLIFPVRQTSVSMAPDISENSIVMVSPIVKNYERGDVVLLESRVSQEKTSSLQKLGDICAKFFTAQQLAVKENEKLPGTKQQLRRIIGMPGDTIYMRDYVMYVKPAGEKHFLTEFEITPKTYNVTFFTAPAGWDSSLGVKGSFDEIKLSENEYFVFAPARTSTLIEGYVW